MKYSLNICTIVCLTILIFSCNEYKEILFEVERINISIYNIENNKDNYCIEIYDKNEITTISKFISGISSPMYKCGYNGKIEFYCKNNNLLLETEFNTDCNTIVFEYKDKSYRRRITNNGLLNLNSVIENMK